MTASERISNLMEEAVALFGSEAKLGKAIGCSQNAVWHAKRQGRVSAEMAVAIDRATGGSVSKTALRPDLWQPDEPAACKATQRNWIVYTDYDYLGSRTTAVPGIELKIVSGALVFVGAGGGCSSVFSPGSWSHVVEQTPSNPEPGSLDRSPMDGPVQ